MDTKKIFRPKTEEEIAKIIDDLSVEEAIKLGAKLNDRYMVVSSIKKMIQTGDTLFARKTMPISTNNLYILEQLIDNDRYVKIKELISDKYDEYSVLFFGERFKPIYKNNEELKEEIKIVSKWLNAVEKYFNV